MATNDAAYFDPNRVLTINGVEQTATVLTSSGGNVAIDAAQGPRFNLELTEATTQLNNPSNLAEGQLLVVLIKQDATGSRALTFGTNWLLTDGITSNIDTTASTVTVLTGYVASLPNGPGLRIYFTLEHAAETAGGGGVAGPGSSTNTAIATWNGTGGDTLSNTTFTLNATTLAQTTANGAFTLQAGNSTTATTAGALNVTAGDNSSTGAGGAATFQAGDSTSTGGNGGALTLRSGNSSSANAGSLTINVGTSASSSPGTLQLSGSTNSNGRGGHIQMDAGNAGGTNQSGGTLTFNAGDSTGSGTPGSITLTSGTGANSTLGTITVNGGDINITASAKLGGNGGKLTFTAGTQTTGGTTNGDIEFKAGGYPSGSGISGGTIYLRAGTISTGGTGGHIYLYAGSISGSATLNPGNIYLYAGSAGTGGSVNAGDVFIYGGNTGTAGGGSGSGGDITLTGGTGQAAGGASAGGDVNLIAGPSSNAGAAGNINITAGQGGTTAAGGSIYLQPGRTTSGSTHGSVVIKRTTSNIPTELQFEDATGDVIGIKAPSTLTAYTLTLPTAVATENDQVLTSNTSGTLTWAAPVARHTVETTISSESQTLVSGSLNRINTSGGALATVNLPTASTNTGRIVRIAKVTTDTNTFTLKVASGNVNAVTGTTGVAFGASGVVLLTAISDGTDWWVG